MLFRALAFVLLLPPPMQASAQQTCPEPKLVFDYDDPVVSANDSRLWSETRRIVRLPDTKRAAEIAHVYHDILSVLHPRRYPLANWHIGSIGGSIGGLDDYSRSIPGSVVRGPAVSMYAQSLSLALLRAYPKEAQPLIQRDLRSSGLEAVERGLFVAERMSEARFPDLYDDLKALFLSGGECSERAQRALFSYVGFPASFKDARRARVHELTPVIVTRFQEDPARYSNFLMHLLAVGPVPSEVLAALESDDSTIRQHASGAVLASTDPRLASYVGRMLTDANQYVRLNAFSIGFEGVRRRDTAYKDLKPALETLMLDSTWLVRLRTIGMFAFTGDLACVPVLVDLLKRWAQGDSTIPDGDFAQVAIYAESISRRKFGFGDGTLPPRRDPANTRAIDRFSNWVKARNGVVAGQGQQRPQYTHAYYLFLAQPTDSCEPCYIPLLLTTKPLDEMARAKRDEPCVVITTYERDSIWTVERRVVVPSASIQFRERRLRLRDRVYRYQEIGSAEVLRLLENPSGTIAVHRIVSPPTRAELEDLATAFRSVK